MKEIELYQALWKKYMPVISMRLKQVIRTEKPAQFGMYQFEFHNAGKKRKTGFHFDIELKNGRVVSDVSKSILAKELINMMKQDGSVQSLLSSGHFHFILNSDFTFTIQKAVEAKVESQA